MLFNNHLFYLINFSFNFLFNYYLSFYKKQKIPGIPLLK
nr:MAG TPA: hypothetical protein [Caudoviricetes sp.]